MLWIPATNDAEEVKIQVDMTESTLPPSPPPDSTASDASEAHRFSRRVKYWAAGVGVLFVAVVAGFVIWVIQPTDTYAIKPGSVRNTVDIIEVEGTESYQPDGEIGFTTVTLAANISRWEKWRFEDDPVITLVPEEVINGDQTAEQRREADLAQMESSKDVATLVALDYLGVAGDPQGSGALVRSVVPGSAADGVLESTDVVIEADGESVEFADDLVNAVRSRSPGDELSLRVTTLEAGEKSVTVTLGESEDGANAQLGVEVSTFDLTADFPFDVEIDSGRVSGPSAGLAFTLGIIDVLTPGELTGGLSVATTGTINIDGSIGPVGGVAQKAHAARESGVDVFIVPSSEYDEAQTQAGEMRIEQADTLEEAIAVLDSFGGNGLALGEF